jgi:hypothetical protein
MWMVFTNSDSVFWVQLTAVTSVAILDGVLVVGNLGASSFYYGVFVFDFPEDNWYGKTAAGSTAIGKPLTTLGTASTIMTGLPTIVSSAVNDVAITYLDDAPLDAWGMRVPTIAAATEGGVSVIKDDGTITNITASQRGKVDFDSNGRLWNAGQGGGYWGVNYYSADYSTFEKFSYALYSATPPQLLASAPTLQVVAGSNHVSGGTIGLTRLFHNPATRTSGSVAYLTNAYNTGWMVGDIRRCWLANSGGGSDTELATNGVAWVGAIGITPPDSWTKSLGEADADFTVSAGVLTMTNGAVDSRTVIRFPFTTIVGESYSVDVAGLTDGTSGVGAASVRVVDTDNYADTSPVNITTSSAQTKSFIATTTTSYIFFINLTAGAGLNIAVDDISVKRSGADRSVKNQPITIVGTVTETVNAGGRNVYSGFSTANYLQEASHADWNALGTGDFSIIMSGVKWGTALSRCLFSMGDGATAGSVFLLLTIGGQFNLYVHNGASIIGVCAGGVFTDTAEHTLEIKRSTVAGVTGTIQILVDGVVAASGVSTLTISNATGYLRIGGRQDASQPWTGGQVSTFRISATAPTAEQSAKIAFDENKLNGGELCLLSNSASVSALSYDESTDVYSVGNGTNVDQFKGLKRLSSAAHGVTTLTALASGGGAKVVVGTGGSYARPYQDLNSELKAVQLELAEANQGIVTKLIASDASSVLTFPQGFKPKRVMSAAGTYISLSTNAPVYDGFIWKITSGLAAATDYDVEMVRV